MFYVYGANVFTAVNTEFGGYWCNNVYQNYVNPTSPAYVSSIFVSGGLVYVGGDNGGSYASYWTNGTNELAPENGWSNCSIFVQNGKVYSAGVDDQSNACYWINQAEQPPLCANGTAYSIQLSCGNTYIAGIDKTASLLLDKRRRSFTEFLRGYG